MARLTLVRHGRAASGWQDDADPELDDVGVAQAASMAQVLAPSGPWPVVVSPMKRTRQTAAALERQWSTEARVEPAVGEIPTPSGLPDLASRGPWLVRLMAGTWDTVDDPVLVDWRQGVLDALSVMDADTVVVSHFVAINVAVGAAVGDARLVSFRPDNCSRTVLDNHGGRLRLVELGHQAKTEVG
ncbi:MAG: histidine phosphatase family protein [Acidimicrobiales bacterium]